MATTRSPTAKPAHALADGHDLAGAVAAEVPSSPGYMPSALSTSRKLRPLARTRISTSPGTGCAAVRRRTMARFSSVPRSAMVSRSGSSFEVTPRQRLAREPRHQAHALAEGDLRLAVITKNLFQQRLGVIGPPPADPGRPA